MSSERQKSWPGGNLLSKIEQQSKLHFHTSHQQSGGESKAPEICFGPFGKSASAQISAPIGFREEDRRFLPDDDERFKMLLEMMTIMMLEMWRLKNLKCHVTRLTGSLHHYNNFKPLPGHFDHHRFIEITTNTLFNLHPSSDTKSKQPPA